MALKLSQPCQMWIEEAIEEGLEKGISLSEIGRQTTAEILKRFEVKVASETIRMRASRARIARTNVQAESTHQDNSHNELRKPEITSTPLPTRAVSPGPGKGTPDQPRKYPPKAIFNRTNDNIKWAKWTWNPVTGCLHDCPYCYARDIANRFYEQKFKPTFHPQRLTAPINTPLPDAALEGERNVFVCSMADLFGAWVDQKWIDAVLEAVHKAPEWDFLFLTKNPGRLVGIDWPVNAIVGTTVDKQERVLPAMEAFTKIKASATFLSCEPLLERLDFSDFSVFDLSMFDWIIIGGCSVRGSEHPKQPDWDWVMSLYFQAYNARIPVYLKENLDWKKPQDYPKFLRRRIG